MLEVFKVRLIALELVSDAGSVLAGHVLETTVKRDRLWPWRAWIKNYFGSQIILKSFFLLKRAIVFNSPFQLENIL